MSNAMMRAHNGREHLGFGTTELRQRLVAQIAFVFQGRSGGVESITVKFSVLFELDTFRQYLYCLFAYMM